MARYKLVNGTYLQLHLTHNGRKHLIEFQGGRPGGNPKSGFYFSSKPFIDEFLQKHPWFGKKFVLDEIPVIKPLPPKPAPHIEGRTPTTKDLVQRVNVIEEEPEDVKEPQKVFGIRSGAQAKRWILDNIEGVTQTELKNNLMILEVARKNSLEFPDWTI